MTDHIPDWIMALSAVAALVAAVIAGIISYRLLKVEVRRDAASQTRERAGQASQVSAWCILFEDFDTARLNSKEVPPDKNGLRIQNGSATPIYNVEILSRDRTGQEKRPLKLEVLPPGDYVVTSHATYNWGFPYSVEAAPGSSTPITKNRTWVVTSLPFNDCHGSRWQRLTDGSLSELPTGAEPS